MAAKGAISKQIVTKKILETFEGSFEYEKEIRIPLIEEGNEIQLKCVLTCAKNNVVKDGENILPGEENISDSSSLNISNLIEPTEEEKNNVKDLIKALGL